MTIEEALQRVRELKKCFIVWREDTGEVVSVEDASDGSMKGFASRLQGMGEKGPFPTSARFFDAGQVTAAVLHGHAAQCAKTNRRAAIFKEWARASPEQLVEVLEKEEYQEPYVGKRDADYVMRLLFHLHADELTATRSDLFGRLRRLRLIGAGYGTASLILAQHLAVLDGDAARLKELYLKRPYGFGLFHFTEAFGDVRCADPQIIEELIAEVERPGMFGPRVVAMVALGKIGAAAGSRAAEVIRANIYNSSEWVARRRDRVLERITSPPASWVRCGRCCRGRVLSFTLYCPWPVHCPRCLEMGLISAESSD
jgi:hypothetical protein